jgi:transcriptional regulator with GAF, ATPase, and Fis domain
MATEPTALNVPALPFSASASQRDTLLAQTFVQLADTLVKDFDVVELLTVLSSRCIKLFNVSEAGILLADPQGEFRVVAASSESVARVEHFEIRNQEGPCLECIGTGLIVNCEDLNAQIQRYPHFAREALDAGFRSAFALPMRLRDQTIEALSLLGPKPNPLSADDLVPAQALADVATIGVLQHQAADEARTLSGQLQHALDSRVIIEQAKGILAQAGGIDVEESFAALRRYTRSRGERLTDVAGSIVDGGLTTGLVVRNSDAL